MAERANRTIKERLYRFMSHNKTTRWVDAIQKIVSAVNHSACSSIGGRRPVDVTYANAPSIREEIEEENQNGVKKQVPPRFQTGDLVRIEKYKHLMEKGYTGNFTTEIFSVCGVRQSPLPVTYQLADTCGEQIRGWFYAQDLSLVRLPPPAVKRGRRNKNTNSQKTLQDSEPIWAIEHVLKKRKGQGGVEYSLVKWKGFNASHNSWIPSRSIIDIITA
jgi:hypothetical protein